MGTHRSCGWPNSSYVVSKVAVSALTRIQQRRFDVERPEDDMVVNSVHPGYVVTDMTGKKGNFSPERGAQVLVWCALLGPKILKPRGDYVWHDNTIVDWVNGPMPSNV